MKKPEHPMTNYIPINRVISPYRCCVENPRFQAGSKWQDLGGSSDAAAYLAEVDNEGRAVSF